MQDRISIKELYGIYALLASKRSTCKRYGTGSILTSPDLYHIWSIGYNGTPKKTPNVCNGKEGSCLCIHSETNAILKAQHTKHGILFTTHSPCQICAGYIIQAEIDSVFYINRYRLSAPILFLKNNGIPCEQLKSNLIDKFKILIEYTLC